MESVPDPEDSSPLLTWSWGISGVSPGESVLVSSGGMHVRFPPSCSSSVELPFARIKESVAFPRDFPTRLSHEAFPRGFPTGLTHVSPLCKSILGLKVEAVQGKQVSMDWTRTFGGLWEWWHDPGVPLAFPVESASS